MAVDQIEANHPGRVAPIEWHTSSSYPLYCAEARARWYTYPPPYWYNGGWYYATPWAWIDGKNRGYQASSWESWTQQQLAAPAAVGVVLTGEYTPGGGSGNLNIEMVNPTDSAVSANLYVVVTEDSLYYAAPNGDVWHNHVCRDYVTGTSGAPVTVPAMGADTLVQPFTIEGSWVERNCHLVAFLQNPTVQADSSRPVYQGATVPLLSLVGVAEVPAPRIARKLEIANPHRLGYLRLPSALGTGTVEVCNLAGRTVREVQLSGRDQTLSLEGLSEGVYLVRLTGQDKTETRKLVFVR